MKLFVWDFHGVLEKDNEKAVIDISNRILSQAGHKERFTHEDVHRCYGLKIYEYFERLLPGHPQEEHLALQTAFFKFAEAHLHILAKHIKPNDHAVEVLDKITQSNNQQIVISNTRPADLLWFLNAIGIREFFDPEHIIGVNAHEKHGDKLAALKEHLKNTQFDQIIVIGDSESDLVMGKEVGAVTYFYKHPHRRHESTKYADHIIRDLREVLKEL